MNDYESTSYGNAPVNPYDYEGTQTKGGEGCRRKHLEQLRADEDLPAIFPVSHHTAHEREQKYGDFTQKGIEPEKKRIVGELIN